MDPEGGGWGSRDPSLENHISNDLLRYTDPGHPGQSQNLTFESHNMRRSKGRGTGRSESLSPGTSQI